MNEKSKNIKLRFLELIERLGIKGKNLEIIMNASKPSISRYKKIDETSNKFPIENKYSDIEAGGLSMMYLEYGTGYPLSNNKNGEILEINYLHNIKKSPKYAQYSRYVEWIRWRWGSVRNFCEKKDFDLFNLYDILCMEKEDTLTNVLIDEGMDYEYKQTKTFNLKIVKIPDQPYQKENLNKVIIHKLRDLLDLLENSEE